MSKINFLEILKKYQTVQLNLQAKDWKDAVLLATQPLIDKGLVTKKYYEAIIQNTIAHGPYYIIADHLAMPHAQSEAGVIENAFSLVTLQTPVYFENDERPISVLITLAATSPEIHTSEALPQIVAVFEDPKTVDQIRQCQSSDEVYNVISAIDFQKYLA